MELNARNVEQKILGELLSLVTDMTEILGGEESCRMSNNKQVEVIQLEDGDLL